MCVSAASSVDKRPVGVSRYWFKYKSWLSVNSRRTYRSRTFLTWTEVVTFLNLFLNLLCSRSVFISRSFGPELWIKYETSSKLLQIFKAVPVLIAKMFLTLENRGQENLKLSRLLQPCCLCKLSENYTVDTNSANTVSASHETHELVFDGHSGQFTWSSVLQPDSLQ